LAAKANERQWGKDAPGREKKKKNEPVGGGLTPHVRRSGQRSSHIGIPGNLAGESVLTTSTEKKKKEKGSDSGLRRSTRTGKVTPKAALDRSVERRKVSQGKAARPREPER